MYINYGDRNFFECGRLVDSEHSDDVISVIYCEPYSDEENAYQFAVCDVDVTDSWLDKKKIMDFIGMDEDSFNAADFAVGCVDYYGPENWDYDDVALVMTRKDVEDRLKSYMIACDNLDITW